MKILLVILFFTLMLTPSVICNAAEGPVMEDIKIETRGYDLVEIPAGTFIPVMSSQEISTEYCPEGFKVRFTATNDLYMYETNIIPENTVFYGFIEKLNEPVIGTNASMIIKITKMILPDGYEVPIRGYIYTSNNNLIGGEMSAPAEWRKMPHYQTRFKNHITLQIRPGRARKMGTHVKISAGEDELIILSDSAWITHTVTN